MINKYQAGGATQGSILQEIAKLPLDLQKKIMTAFGKWAQAKGLNIQQLQGNEQALEQAMGQFLQEMQASQAPKARLGAKLNYIRNLKGNAPEGMVVEYYKCGGQTKKRFVKAAGGEKVKDGKKEIDDFKKKACGGARIPKNQPGSKMIQFVEANKERKKKEAEDRKREEKWRKGEIIVGKDIQRGNGGPNTTKRLDSAVPNEDVPSHDRKAKKHQYGGSLNSIPFYQFGTGRGGIKFARHESNNTTSLNRNNVSYTGTGSNGSSLNVLRMITPNDTIYYATTYDKNGGMTNSMAEMGGQLLVFRGKAITPGSTIGRGQFKNWKDYFNHLESLRKPQVAKPTPSRYYLSMAM